MFDGIGYKIKLYARIGFWVGVALSVLSGLSNIIKGITNFDLSTALAGFIVLVLGPVLSWIGSIVLYGFGELIENTGMILHIKKKEIASKKESE